MWPIWRNYSLKEQWGYPWQLHFQTTAYRARCITWYLTALNHYLNQCWLIMHEVSWNAPKGNLMGYYQYIYLWYFSQWGNELTVTSVVPHHFGFDVLTCCCTVMRHKLWFHFSTNSPSSNHKSNLWFFSRDYKWNPFVMFCIISRCQENC